MSGMSFLLLAYLFTGFVGANFVESMPVNDIYPSKFEPAAPGPDPDVDTRINCKLPPQEQIEWDKVSGPWYQIMSSEYSDEGNCFGINKIRGTDEQMEFEMMEYNIGKKSFRRIAIKGQKNGCKYEWKDFQEIKDPEFQYESIDDSEPSVDFGPTNYPHSGSRYQPDFFPGYENNLGSENGPYSGSGFPAPEEGVDGSGYNTEYHPINYALVPGSENLTESYLFGGPETGYLYGPEYGSGTINEPHLEAPFEPNIGSEYANTGRFDDGGFYADKGEEQGHIRFIESVFSGKYVMVTDYDNFMIILMQESEVNNRIIVHTRTSRVTSYQLSSVLNTLNDIGEGWSQFAMHLSNCVQFDFDNDYRTPLMPIDFGVDLQ